MIVNPFESIQIQWRPRSTSSKWTHCSKWSCKPWESVSVKPNKRYSHMNGILLILIKCAMFHERVDYVFESIGFCLSQYIIHSSQTMIFIFRMKNSFICLVQEFILKRVLHYEWVKILCYTFAGQKIEMLLNILWNARQLCAIFVVDASMQVLFMVSIMQTCQNNRINAMRSHCKVLFDHKTLST